MTRSGNTRSASVRYLAATVLAASTPDMRAASHDSTRNGRPVGPGGLPRGWVIWVGRCRWVGGRRDRRRGRRRWRLGRGGGPLGSSGLGLDRSRRPWGLVKVSWWSALPWMVQPPSWTRWWCSQQSPQRFQESVGPLLVQCWMWWRWRMRRPQPGNRQVPSRWVARRRSQRGEVRPARPMPMQVPSGPSMLNSIAQSQSSRRTLSAGMGMPSMDPLPSPSSTTSDWTCTTTTVGSGPGWVSTSERARSTSASA